MLGSTAWARLPRKLTAESHEQHGMGAQQGERTERIGAPPREADTLRRRQRFRQHQKSVAGVGRLKPAAIQNGNRGEMLPAQSTERRPENKSGAKRSAQQSEARGALIRRRHVGHIGVGRGDA